jgi:hypothetical protein
VIAWWESGFDPLPTDRHGGDAFDHNGRIGHRRTIRAHAIFVDNARALGSASARTLSFPEPLTNHSTPPIRAMTLR